MENEKNQIVVEQKSFFSSKTNGILLALIVLMIVAIMLGDKQKYFPMREDVVEEVTQDDEQVKDTYTYTNHGFSIELPKGFVPFEDESATGPSVNILLPGERNVITVISDMEWWNKFNMSNLAYVGTEQIGSTTFKIYNRKDNKEWPTYLYQKNNVGYWFSGDKNMLKTFKFVGWPIESKTFSTEKFTFQAPSNWNESSVVQRGCSWFSVAAPSSGMVTKGEIGIYPVSCFDLSKQQKEGLEEVSQKNGYYIIYSFDDSMTKEELDSSKKVYKEVLETFVLK